MKLISSVGSFLGVLLEAQHYLKKAEQPQAILHDLKTEWALSILSKLNVELEILGDVSAESSMLFVGNHISYLDIPLLMSTVRGVSFVAKHELSSWPIFGRGAKKLDTVFVKRESGGSRRLAKSSIESAVNEGKKIVIFPSGTTSLDEVTSWRKGAFEIAMTTQRPVQPFRISYEPLRATAYIDDDFFPVHLLKLLQHKRIKARLEFHSPVPIQNPIADCLRWQEWAKGNPHCALRNASRGDQGVSNN